MSAHPQHFRLVELAREYLTMQWADETQIQRYLDHNSPMSAPPVTPHHTRAAMMALAARGEAEGAHFQGDRVMHWRRRRAEVA